MPVGYGRQSKAATWWCAAVLSYSDREFQGSVGRGCVDGAARGGRWCGECCSARTKQANETNLQADGMGPEPQSQRLVPR